MAPTLRKRHLLSQNENGILIPPLLTPISKAVQITGRETDGCYNPTPPLRYGCAITSSTHEVSREHHLGEMPGTDPGRVPELQP